MSTTTTTTTTQRFRKGSPSCIQLVQDRESDPESHHIIPLPKDIREMSLSSSESSVPPQDGCASPPLPRFPEYTSGADVQMGALAHPTGSPVRKREFLLSLEDLSLQSGDMLGDAHVKEEANDTATLVASDCGSSAQASPRRKKVRASGSPPMFGTASVLPEDLVVIPEADEHEEPHTMDNVLDGDADMSLGEISAQLSKMADEVSYPSDTTSSSVILSPASSHRTGIEPSPKEPKRLRPSTAEEARAVSVKPGSTPRPRSPRFHRNARTRRPLEPVDPHYMTLFQKSWSIKRRDIKRLHSGRRIDIRHSLDMDCNPTVSKVPAGMLTHFCGRRTVKKLLDEYMVEEGELDTGDDAIREGKTRVKNDVLIILDSEADHIAVARVLRYMRRCCKPSKNYRPQSDIIVPPAAKDTIDTIRACRIFGLDADADRLESVLVRQKIPYGLVTIEDIKWLWDGLDGELRDSPYIDALLCFIRFGVVGRVDAVYEQVKHLLDLQKYRELREKVNKEFSTGSLRIETKNQFLDRKEEQRAKRMHAEGCDARANDDRLHPNGQHDDHANDAAEVVDDMAGARYKRSSGTFNTAASPKRSSGIIKSFSAMFEGKSGKKSRPIRRSDPAPAEQPFHRSDQRMSGTDLPAGGRRNSLAPGNQGKAEKARSAVSNPQGGVRKSHPPVSKNSESLLALLMKPNVDKPLPPPPRLSPIARPIRDKSSTSSCTPSFSSTSLDNPQMPLDNDEPSSLPQRPPTNRTTSSSSTSLIRRTEPCPTCGRRSPKRSAFQKPKRSSIFSFGEKDSEKKK